MTNFTSKILLVAAGAIGASVGGFALASAVGGGAQSEESRAEEARAGMSLLPPTRGDEPQLFEVRMSGISDDGVPSFRDGVVSVTLSPSSDGGVCVVTQAATGTTEGCLPPDLLATGLAYGATRDHDGPVEIVGYVPDEVASVEIDGHTIKPIGNVWHYSGTAGDDLSFTVYNSDRSLSASIG